MRTVYGLLASLQLCIGWTADELPAGGHQLGHKSHHQGKGGCRCFVGTLSGPASEAVAGSASGPGPEAKDSPKGQSQDCSRSIFWKFSGPRWGICSGPAYKGYAQGQPIRDMLRASLWYNLWTPPQGQPTKDNLMGQLQNLLRFNPRSNPSASLRTSLRIFLWRSITKSKKWTGLELWDGIFKILRSPGIDSKELIPSVYVLCSLTGTTTLF